MKKRLLSMFLCLCMFASLFSVTAQAAAFTDVDASAYYATPVAWAVEEGITTGKTATEFKPNEVCTRAQIITFLWRAAGSPESRITTKLFKDITEEDYCYEAAMWACEMSILTVIGQKFDPNAPCTRADAVSYIWRYAGCPFGYSIRNFYDVSRKSVAAYPIRWAVGYGVTNGVTPYLFEPDSICTRGQIVTYLYRYFVEPIPAEERGNIVYVE